jgi:transcriptional regulator with XRE-family HTH domain
MDFISRVEQLLFERSTSVNKMLNDLSMGGGTFATWKARNTIPNGEALSKIADYFGVTVDYLLGKTDEKNKPETDDGLRLTKDEIDLIKAYRSSDPAIQAAIDRLTGIK